MVSIRFGLIIYIGEARTVIYHPGLLKFALLDVSRKKKIADYTFKSLIKLEVKSRTGMVGRIMHAPAQ